LYDLVKRNDSTGSAERLRGSGRRRSVRIDSNINLNSCWNMITQELINGAIDQWSKRLSLVVRYRDGHIEHRFS